MSCIAAYTPNGVSYCCHAFAQMACAIITIMMQRYKKDLKLIQFSEKKHIFRLVLSLVHTINSEKLEINWKI